MQNHTPTVSANFHLLFLLVCFLLALTILPVPTAYAQAASLKIAPSVLQLRAMPPANIEAPFMIENQSNQAIKLNIGYKIFNKAESSNGIVTYLNDSDLTGTQQKDIFNKIQIVNEDNTSIDSIELGPKQQKKLQLKISLPKGEKTADYYFSLVLIQNNAYADNADSYMSKKDQKSVSTLQAGIALNVLLGVGPRESTNGYIDTYEAPSFSETNKVPMNLSVTNTGTHYMTPHGTIQIKNILGTTVNTIQIPPTVILAGTKRILADNTEITSHSLENPQIVWKSNYPLGFYTANLALALSDSGPFFTKSTTFVVLPMRFALLLLLLIVGIIIFARLQFKRLKK